MNAWSSERAPLKVPHLITDAKFERLSPEIEIRLGMTPLLAELRLDPKLIREGKLSKAEVVLRSQFPPGLFKTHGIMEERNNCVSGKETPVLKDNEDVTDATVELSQTAIDPATHTLKVPLHYPWMVEPKADAFKLILRVGEKSYETDLSLSEPYTLHPVLAEILKQYRKISATAISSEFPPVVKRVVKDCDDTKIIERSFTPKDRYHPKPEELGHIGNYRVVKVDGWIFAAKSKDGAFSFKDVSFKSMTFLGDKYSQELIETKTQKDRLVAKIELGDFADCFGSGCGEPINVRDAYVSITKDGLMSTEFKKHKKR